MMSSNIGRDIVADAVDDGFDAATIRCS